MEVVYTGLRNPQEIAFDAYGNLFAADNNCDKGDYARLVYIVDGGHSGWNMSYQSIAAPYLTGPWHAEKIWHVEHPDRPLSVLPPIAPLGAGPSGFAFSPGSGLPERYQQAFFMCNYTGNEGIEAFSLKAKGAGFEMVDAHDFLKPISDILRPKQPDGQIIEVSANEIDDRSPANSAMPNMRRTLSPDDLRDLIEILAESR